ncbi:Hypothetical_protein [Hexamita inflata]|uniref:Hypothetical_protein n=1 Tax=Hexamita inflata TaxID=28002 RepID=A0AA86TQ84_9EUKA|nr:Hypothetical protein HINF_LOCUS10367 [Hexamita inflata]
MRTILLIVKLEFQQPLTSATFVAALTFPKTLVSLISIYLAQQQPIAAATLISVSSQLAFAIEIKQIFKLLNDPRMQFEDKNPTVPKLEKEPFPVTEQFTFTFLNEIFPSIFPNKPDQFTTGILLLREISLQLKIYLNKVQ